MTKPSIDMIALRKAFAGVSGLYVLGIPLTFLMNVMLARMLSIEDFAAFGFVLSFITVLSIPVVAGLPMLLTREVASYTQKGAIGLYRGIVQTAHLWVILFSIVALLIGFGFSYFQTKGITQGALGKASLIGLFLLPFFGLNAIRGGIMKGLGHPVLSEAPTQLLQPLFLIAGIWVLHIAGLMSAQAVLIWYVVATALVLVVAYGLLLSRQPAEMFKTKAEYSDRRRWLRAILPFSAMSAIWTLTAQVAILLLGFFGETEGVATMRVAERAAMLISFPLMFVNASVGPIIVSLYRGRDIAGLQRTARYAARLAAMASIPIALVLVFGGHFLISVTFGETYAALAYIPMVILVIAQAASVLLGPAGIILVMTGRERLNLWIQIIGLIVFVSIASTLIGPYGAVGAAIGAASGVLLSSVLAFLAVRWKLQIRTSII